MFCLLGFAQRGQDGLRGLPGDQGTNFFFRAKNKIFINQWDHPNLVRGLMKLSLKVEIRSQATHKPVYLADPLYLYLVA